MISIKSKLIYKSIDLKNYENPHNVKVLKRLGRKKIIVEFIPPLPGDVYKQKRDIDKAILVPRYACVFFSPAFMAFKVCVNLYVKNEYDLSGSQIKIVDVGDIIRKWNTNICQINKLI